MVLGCIIYCLYFGKELTKAFMVEPVNQPYYINTSPYCNGCKHSLVCDWDITITNGVGVNLK